MRIFVHVDCPSFTRISIHHEIIHATRVVTLSAEEPGTIYKSNLWEQSQFGGLILWPIVLIFS